MKAVRDWTAAVRHQSSAARENSTYDYKKKEGKERNTLVDKE